MPLTYVCRHCQQVLGTIDRDVPEYQLGFHFLTPEERRDIILGETDRITVMVICEVCQEALEANPELALYQTLIQ